MNQPAWDEPIRSTTTICAHCEKQTIDTATRGHAWFLRHVAKTHGAALIRTNIEARRLRFEQHVAALESYVAERRAA
jgi:hypothetical protein